ncbi:hypothetical protein [Leptolyngbya phage Lbo-JY46]
MKIVTKKGREKLEEGRDHGLGFAFAKLQKYGLKAMMPLSACKDYLNDVVYTELTGEKIGSIYGFSYGVKKNIFLQTKYGFLLMSVLNHRNGTEWPLNSRYLKAFVEGIKNCQSLINTFCREILQEECDFKILQHSENLFYCCVPPVFLTNTYGISLLTLLLRNGYKYSEGTPIKDFLKNPPKDFYTSDLYMLNDLSRIIDIINLYTYISSPQKTDLHINTVHNQGILSLKYTKI